MPEFKRIWGNPTNPSIYKDVIIIAQTGHLYYLEDKERIIEEGCNDYYFRSPFNKGKLTNLYKIISINLM